MSLFSPIFREPSKSFTLEDVAVNGSGAATLDNIFSHCLQTISSVNKCYADARQMKVVSYGVAMSIEFGIITHLA